MKQILKQLLKQKTKLNEDIGKIYYNIEINEEELNKIFKQIETSEMALRNRKNKSKTFEDLSLRILEFKKCNSL